MTSTRSLRRLRGFAAVVLCAVAAAAQAAGNACAEERWPLWEDFRSRFVEPEGRVVDRDVPELHSTSEGQSYAMFFALVAQDRPSFDRVWGWTLATLLRGEQGTRLPAWRWGKRTNGEWAILDDNAASDADLWIAYALLEAGRLWKHPAYTNSARLLMARIAEDEVTDVPGIGLMLLPAPAGFAWRDDAKGPYVRWRFNPSYVPIPVMRRLAEETPRGPWHAIAVNHARLITGTSALGFAPDWALYTTRGGFTADMETGDAGSYDAIRAYLWAGLVPAADPLARPMRDALNGMARLIASTGEPPETVRAATGATKGIGPAGFSAALVPFLQASGFATLANAQRDRAQAMLAQQAGRTRYYDHALALFGLGWAEQRYRFLPSGQLLPRRANHKGASSCY